MELLSVKKSINGKSAWASYSFLKHKMDVYLRHNEPCKTCWGDFYISAFVKPNNGNSETGYSFTSYAEFRKFREEIESKINN